MAQDDDQLDVDEAERAAAATLARALECRIGDLDPRSPAATEAADALDVEAANSIRAAAGHAPRLGEVRARGLARAAVEEARRRPMRTTAPTRRRWPWMAISAAAAIALAVGLALADRSSEKLPERLYARSAGQLVPGPFPTSQTAAQRLDLVTNNRLIAFRERRVRAVARGAR